MLIKASGGRLEIVRTVQNVTEKLQLGGAAEVNARSGGPRKLSYRTACMLARMAK